MVTEKILVIPPFLLCWLCLVNGHRKDPRDPSFHFVLCLVNGHRKDPRDPSFPFVLVMSC